MGVVVKYINYLQLFLKRVILKYFYIIYISHKKFNASYLCFNFQSLKERIKIKVSGFDTVPVSVLIQSNDHF